MQVEESYMAVNVVAVDNAPELLEKSKGFSAIWTESVCWEPSRKRWLWWSL